MRHTAAAAAMAAAPLLIVALRSGEEPREQPPTAFAVPSLAARAAPLPGSAAASVRRTVLKAEAFTEGVSAGRCAIGGAAMAMLAGFAAWRRSSQPRSRVGMRGRGQNWLRPNAKGSKPMISRPITRDIMLETMNGWKKKYKGAGDIEDIMKKTIYGKVQFQWSSQTFTDDMPFVPPAGSRQSSNRGLRDDDVRLDAVLVRKYKEPSKFKKLQIVNWEMPENYTSSVTLQEMVQAGMQYGHASGIWNPEMLKYLYSDFDGTHIFDMVQTAAMMNRACYYAMEAASKGATFLFQGTKQQARPIVAEAAQRTGMFYCDKFVGGLMTNFFQVRKGIRKMRKMIVQQKQGAWRIESDKQQRLNKLILEALIKKYKGVSEMKTMPDIVILVDEVKERNMVNECARIGIPIIGLIDSNNNPKYIDIPVAGNCSGSRSIELFISKITEAIIAGQQIRANTAPGDLEEIPKEWDPWIFSRDRMRQLRRRSKRQPWMKTVYGGYEQFKKANPYGRIPSVAPFDPDFSWPHPVSVTPQANY
mmetsp:Transcript_56801/g.176662  ORF Transcript_56801/g.176662 Transcript_56801/m.176662 type:complete len:531 (-) Transcript_56801:67-1659(-)